MGMNYFITAQGYPGLGMLTTLIGAIVNIVLDPVFIFGLEMDIAGAAVATVIAQMSSCIFVLYTLKRKKMRIPLTLVKPEREIGKRIVKIGFLSVFDSGIRQCDHHCAECCFAVLRRSRLRGYVDHGGYDRAKLYAFDHGADAWRDRRVAAAY